MGLRYSKKIRISRNLTLNISKSGLSLTVRKGKGGVNISKRGIMPFFNIGKGFFWRK
ncbi:DUF4236 domain-containing protein [Rhodococcus sp. IEGM1300]